MVQGEDLGLTFEPGAPLGVPGEGRGKDLERHLTVEGGVDGAPHRTHPALADLFDETVVQQRRSG